MPVLRLLFLLSTLLSLYSFVHGEALNCDFDTREWDEYVEDPYICKASPVDFDTRVTINEVNGDHSTTLSNDDVTALLIYEENCAYFPIAIEKFFKNLRGIAIQKSKLRAIRRRDLEPFPDLVSLSLYGNKLTTLDYDLFRFNPKIISISFHSNKISAIGSDLFDNLHDLQEAFFEKNKCINLKAEGEPQMKKLKQRILNECKPTEDMKMIRELYDAVHLNKGGASSIVCSNYEDKVCSFACADFNHDEMEISELRHSNGTIIPPEDITEVVITGYSAKHLPSNLGDFFRNLEKLTIDGTEITTINKDTFANLEKLTKLQMTNGKLLKIHKDALNSLSSVESIDFSNNELVDVEDISVSSLKNLKTLNFHNNKIASIDVNAFKDLDELESINLEDNELSHVHLISRGKNLKELSLKGNKCIDLKYPDDSFEKIAEEAYNKCPFEAEWECEFTQDDDDYVCNARNINNLHKNTLISKVIGNHPDSDYTIESVTKFIANNQVLYYIPPNFNTIFSNVKKIEIDSSQLKELAMFKNLNWVRIIGNNLKNIEKAYFSDSPDIEYIDLSANNIHRLPENFFETLTSVKDLILDDNQLTELIWSNFKHLESLEHLKVQNNKIKSVDSNWIESKSVRIDLTGNTCTDNIITRDDWEETIENVKNSCPIEVDIVCELKNEEEDYVCNTINLSIWSDNMIISKVTDASSQQISADKITKLAVHEQNFEYFPINLNETFPNLSKIEIISSKLKIIPKLNKLGTLKIINNDIKSIAENAFDESPDLSYIDLSNNNIHELSDRLFELNLLLDEIHLDNNKLVKIDWSMFTQLYDLRIINLANNQIKQIDWKGKTTALESVDLSGNACIDAKYEASNMDNLTEDIRSKCGRSSDIQCSFKQISKNYICFTKDLVIETETTKILDVKGTHLTGKTNSDVTRIIVRNQDVKAIPYNILEVFENLKRFEIFDNNGKSNYVFSDGKVQVSH